MPRPIVFHREARLKQTRALLALAFVALGAVAASGAGKPSFADLVANLKSPTAKTRQEAAVALGKSRRREAVAPLAALVRDSEPKVRLEVVRALRELRDLSAVPALVTSIQDGDPQIREEALGALVEIYSEREASDPLGHFLETFSDEYDRASVPPYTNVDPSVYRALSAALADEEKGIREKAAFALGILDGRSEVRALVGALQDSEPKVRGAAATSIGKVGSGEDGKPLIPLLADESTEVRNRVLQALGVLRVREAGPALRELYEANRRKDFGLRVLACLSRIGDPAQGDLFRELLQDPDPDRRRLAVEGLARVADTSMLAAFKKDYQRERSDEIKLSYNFAITLLGDHAFLDSLVLSLSSKTLGTRARNYLLELGSQFSPELYPYLNDQDAEIRARLADLLAQLGNPDAIPHLMPLLSDPNTKVADRANRAVELLKQAPGQAGTPR
jgi:HEAT repeat protein